MLRMFLLLLSAWCATAAASAQIEMAINVDSLTRVPRIMADSLPWKWHTRWNAGFSTTQLTNWTGRL
jgi:hypothetical protein